MRLPAEESFSVQVGLTNDPMILFHLVEGSRGRGRKGSTAALICSLIVLALIAGLMAWCVLTS